MAKYHMEMEGYWRDIKIDYTTLDGHDGHLKIEAIRVRDSINGK